MRRRGPSAARRSAAARARARRTGRRRSRSRARTPPGCCAARAISHADVASSPTAAHADAGAEQAWTSGDRRRGSDPRPTSRSSLGARSITRSASASSAGRWATRIDGATVDEAADGAHDLGLGGAVEARGRLVEHEQRRVAQERARERQALALAGREAGAAVAERGSRGRRAARREPRVGERAPDGRRSSHPAGRGGRCRRSSRRTGGDAAAPTRCARARRRGRTRAGRHRRSAPCPARARAARAAASTSRIRWDR